MRSPISAVHRARSAKVKGKPSPPAAGSASPPAPRKAGRPKKPGPKKGRFAAAQRQAKREKQAIKDAFLPKFDRFIDLLAAGATHRDAMDQAGLSWPEISPQMAGDVSLKARYAAAKDLREEFWKEQRLDELHRRGVVGVKEPMVSAGVRVCDKTVYSDNCLLKAVVADNPTKFADRSKLDATLNAPETLASLVRKIEEETPQGATSPITPPPGLPLPSKKSAPADQ